MRRNTGRVGLLWLAAILIGLCSSAEDLIVYTAHQGFDSRIYLMHMDGTVERYWEYANFRIVDLEVVGGEVYVAEAFAPRADRLDLDTGDLEVIIDDWSLFYFYDLAFDGDFFYVTEWDLNRYDVTGVKDGTASFDVEVMGSAWDGSHLWTLDDAGLIRCWDLSGWPTVTEIPDNAFAPPSPRCRGLFFDGENFLSAESVDGAVGFIYEFDHAGKVTGQWLEPAFDGWGAAIVHVDDLIFTDGFESGDSAAWSVPGDLALLRPR
jgi:hypothetical protein